MTDFTYRNHLVDQDAADTLYLQRLRRRRQVPLGDVHAAAVGISKAVQYVVLGAERGVSVSKMAQYAVLGVEPGVSVSKMVQYAVLQAINAPNGKRTQQEWEYRRVALEETDTYRRPVRGNLFMPDVTYEIVSWAGTESFFSAPTNPTTYASYMGMESWVNEQTVTFGNVDYLGTETFLAHVGLSGAYTAQLMLETWLLAATDEKGVESTKLGAENWLVPASWSAQLSKAASEVFLVVPFTGATIFVTKTGSEVFMEKSGQPSALMPKLGVEIWFPYVADLVGDDDVNVIIWMH